MAIPKLQTFVIDFPIIFKIQKYVKTVWFEQSLLSIAKWQYTSIHQLLKIHKFIKTALRMVLPDSECGEFLEQPAIPRLRPLQSGKCL